MTNSDWLNEPSPATKKLIFVRHGEYECNVLGINNCNPRVPYFLNSKGQEQAKALALTLQSKNIQVIVSSEFLRTRQTAWFVQQTLQVPIIVNSLANENNVGSALDGKSSKLFMEAIAQDPVNWAAVDGESFSSMKKRVVKLVSDLSRSSPDTILIVTHGWILQAVRSLIGEVSDADGAMCIDMPGNCAVIETIWNNGSLTKVA